MAITREEVSEDMMTHDMDSGCCYKARAQDSLLLCELPFACSCRLVFDQIEALPAIVATVITLLFF